MDFLKEVPGGCCESFKKSQYNYISQWFFTRQQSLLAGIIKGCHKRRLSGCGQLRHLVVVHGALAPCNHGKMYSISIWTSRYLQLDILSLFCIIARAAATKPRSNQEQILERRGVGRRVGTPKHLPSAQHVLRGAWDCVSLQPSSELGVKPPSHLRGENLTAHKISHACWKQATRLKLDVKQKWVGLI